jgi:hypothetical protein
VDYAPQPPIITGIASRHQPAASVAPLHFALATAGKAGWSARNFFTKPRQAGSRNLLFGVKRMRKFFHVFFAVALVLGLASTVAANAQLGITLQASDLDELPSTRPRQTPSRLSDRAAE